MCEGFVNDGITCLVSMWSVMEDEERGRHEWINHSVCTVYQLYEECLLRCWNTLMGEKERDRYRVHIDLECI